MSWAATAYAQKLRRASNGEPITIGEKLIMIILANYYNEEKGFAWPSLSRLADETLYSRRGLVSALQSLERKGLLHIVRHPDATKRVTNHYRFPELNSLPSPVTSESGSLDLEKPDSQTGEVRLPALVNSVPPLVNSVPPIFPVTLNDLSKDIAAEQRLETGIGLVPTRRRVKPPIGTAAFNAYSEAHLKRYGVEPVRNSKTNALMSQLVDRLGVEEAPLVAAFYLTVDTPLYVNARHPPTLLLRDCESLRTQWKTGPVRAPRVGHKALQPVPRVESSPAECPPEAAAALSKILGRDAFSFSTEGKGAA